MGVKSSPLLGDFSLALLLDVGKAIEGESSMSYEQGLSKMLSANCKIVFPVRDLIHVRQTLFLLGA